MAELLPNVRSVLRRSFGIKDRTIADAVRNVESWIDEMAIRLSKVDSAAISGLVLPISESDVTGLVADLASKLPAANVAGTTDTLSKFTSSNAIGDSTVTDTGSLVTVGNALKVTGAADFDSTVNIDGAATISTMTAGSVLFAGVAGLISQDNAQLFWDNANDRLGVGTNAPEANTKLHVKTGTGGTASVAGTTLATETAGANYITVKGPAANDKGVLFSNASSATDGAVLYDNASSARGMQLHTADTSKFAIDATGDAFLGTDIFAFTKSFGGGGLEITRTATNSTLVFSAYGTGVTPTLHLYSGRGTPTSTTAVQSGDQIGGVGFTGATSSGATNFFASCDIRAFTTETWTAASNFGGKLEFRTTTNAAGSGGRAVRLTIDHDGTSTFTGALLCNGNLTAGDNTGVDLHTFNGTRTGTNTLGTRSCLGATQTPSGGTTNTTSAIVATNNGTYNTTSGVLSEYGLRAVSSSTRSAGANDLTNVAIYGTASGAQVNVALRTDAGNILLNQTGGTFSCAGAATFTSSLSVEGNAAIGNAGSDAHTLLGTLNANATAGTNGQILQVSGGVPVWGAPSLAGVVDGTGTLNTIPKWTPDGNTIGDSTITDSGSLVTITNALTVTGNTTIGDADGDLHILTGISASRGLVGTTFTNARLFAQDTTPLAAGNGGALAFSAVTNGGGTLSTGGIIRVSKVNATSDNTEFDMLFGARANGASAVEAMRIVGATSSVTIANNLAVTGTITEGGVAVLSGTISGNTIPKGTSGNLVNSAITDDGTGFARLTKNSTSALWGIGDDTAVATDTQNGLKLTAFSDGNNYLDFKTYTSGTSNFRYGSGANTGTASGTWMSLAHATGLVTVTNAFTVNGNATLGDNVADVHLLTGSTAVRTLSGSGTPSSLESGVAGSHYVIHGGSNWGSVVARASNDASGPHRTFYKTRATDAATKTAVQNGDVLGNINFMGATDGSTVNYTASINATVDGAVSAGNIPTGLKFFTGTVATPTLRMTIASSGNVTINQALSVEGNTTLGNATSDTITATAHIPSTLTFASSTGPTIRGGSGTPEGAVTAVVGSLYMRSDGGANTTLYVKESGSGNTGWIAK